MIPIDEEKDQLIKLFSGRQVAPVIYSLGNTKMFVFIKGPQNYIVHTHSSCYSHFLCSFIKSTSSNIEVYLPFNNEGTRPQPK